MSEHMDRLREEQQQAEHEAVVNEQSNLRAHEEVVENNADPAEAYDGPVNDSADSLGARGNDTSKMDLLQSDLDEVLESNKNHESNPEVQQALHDLRDIPVREALEDADSE